jgi:hypothetical protein
MNSASISTAKIVCVATRRAGSQQSPMACVPYPACTAGAPPRGGRGVIVCVARPSKQCRVLTDGLLRFQAEQEGSLEVLDADQAGAVPDVDQPVDKGPRRELQPRAAAAAAAAGWRCSVTG